MGFVRKLTGVEAQINATNQNAVAQAAATKQAAAAQEDSLMQSAQIATQQQSSLAARQAASDQAQEALSVPLATADVQLDASPDTSASAIRKTRAVAFGRDYSTGVQL